MKTFGIIPNKEITHKLLSTIIGLLPKKWQHSFYRNLIDIPQELPKELNIKVASTIKEIQEAFVLVQEQYWKHGLVDKKTTEKLVTKFHILPTASVVIAKWNNEVVGTITLINDSPLGLPSEGLFSFNDLRDKNSKVLAEAAFFAIREDFELTITWPLFKYFYELARRVHTIDTLIIPIPEDKNLFQLCESILFLKALSNDTYTPHPYLNYGAVKLYQLDYLSVNMQMIKHYWKKPLNKDLLSYLHNCEFSNFEFPDEISRKWSPDDLRHLFSEHEDLKESLSEFEKLCLKEFYKESIYENILPPIDPKIIKVEERRNLTQNQNYIPRIVNDRRLAFYSREIRFKTKLSGILYYQEMDTPVQIIDVSLNGMRILSEHVLKLGQHYKLKIQLDNGQSLEVDIKNIWAKKTESLYGFRVEENLKAWPNFIHYLIEKEQAA